MTDVRAERVMACVIVMAITLASITQPAAAAQSISHHAPMALEATTNLDATLNWQNQVAAEDDRFVVYLTFDGGPGPRTPEFLQTLDQWNAKATFFVTGSHTQADPAMLNQIVDRGHVLANHTWDHPDMSSLTRYEAMVQFVATQRVVEAATGITMTCWRPPFGETNDRVQRWADGLGLTNSGWLRNGRWDVDTIDWNNGYEFVLARLNTVQAGDVVLMHGGMNPDVEDLQALITWLQANGNQYRFEALPGCGPPAAVGSGFSAQSSTSVESAEIKTAVVARTASGEQLETAEQPIRQSHQLAFADSARNDGSAVAGGQWYVHQRVSIFLSQISRRIDHSPSLAGT